MYKNIIIIPPCHTYGDCLSVIGMVYFLLDYYNNIYFWIGSCEKIYLYYDIFFKKCKYYNNRIFIIYNKSPEELINNNSYDTFHICNVLSGYWKEPSVLFKNNKNIDTKYYFNDKNPLNNILEIPEKYLCIPNSHYPPTTIDINHLFYYKLVGLNNIVRMDYFHYERDHDKEDFIKKSILKKYNINNDEKYNIINNIINNIHDKYKFIKNNFKSVIIDFQADCPGLLLKLIEDAETIHLGEGSNVNFIYHCQYKNIMNSNIIINFHIWPHNRCWSEYKLDYAWKMMDMPRLHNWKFIFNKDDAI
jgi:hypothetical protein